MGSVGDWPSDASEVHQPSFEVATVVYRRATATRRRAEKMAGEHLESGSTERRLREIDAVLETIILVQAACEAWIFSAYRRVGVVPRTGGGWAQRWIDAPQLICDRDRAGAQPPTRHLDDDTVASLRRISAWRNFLVHNDDRSRVTLRNAIDQEPAVGLLTSALAGQVLAGADQAFADLGSLTGVHGVLGLSSDHLWVAYDE